jgi:hypothetical protein
MRRHLLLADALAWPLLAPEGLLAGAKAVHLRADWLDVGFAAHAARHGPDANLVGVGQLVWGPGGHVQQALGTAPTVFAYLRWLAGALLWRDGEVARLKELRREVSPRGATPGPQRPQAPSPFFGAPGEELLLWRALSLQLPPELLLAALDDGAPQPAARVALLPPQLRFDRRTAHLHAHYGQTTCSAEAWARLPEHLDTMLSARSLPAPGRSQGVCRTGENGAPEGDTTRLTLAELLLRARLFERRLLHHMERHAGDMGDCHTCAEGGDDLWGLLAELAAGRSLTAPGADHARAERNVAGLRLLQRVGVLPGAPEGDLAAQAAAPALLTHGLRKAMAEHRPGSMTEAALAQLLRARSLLHGQLVGDPAAPGLRAFRSGPEASGGAFLALPATSHVYQTAGSAHLRVDAAELRSAPTKPDVQLKQALAKPTKGRPGPAEVGWVPHLSRSVRKAGGGIGAAKRALDEANGLLSAVNVLHTHGERPLTALRGLDLAGDERSGPLWLFRPALMQLRTALDRLAAAEGVPAPGLTLHCGEDFAHLLTGLRAVHEPLRCGLWRQGDRLGHALALGLEPTEWARSRPTVPMRALDRALDLVWVREAATTLGVELSGAELLRLDQELEHLAGVHLGFAAGGSTGRRPLDALDGELWSLSPEAIAELAMGGLGDPGLTRPPPHLRTLIDAGHLDGGPWIEVPTSLDLPLLDRVSSALAHELARRQVLVELNPSSNLIIGALHAPLGQPRLWTRGLTTGQTDPADLRALPVCLSADDPMAFATTLEDEVAYAWAGMVVAGGLSAAWARGWIEEALGAAWRGRFTLPVG